MKIIKIIAFTAFSVAFLNSCYYDNLQDLYPAASITTETCDTNKTISYSADILPILSSNCGTGNSCHNGPASNSGIALADHAGIKSVVDNGKLISAITWDGTASNMPKGGSQKISDCNIAIIKKWVNAGAPNN